ncbi:MAG: FAD-dependent thymidylate synthase [Candidatus Woesearchaeota archaeon]
MKSISDILSVKVLSISPSYKEFGPDEIIAASSKATFKKETIENILKSLSEEEIEKIHEESTRRGHATVSSLPSIDVIFQGTRVLDYFFTSFRYTRALILSSRRINYTLDDCFIPESIKNTEYESVFENIIRKQYNFYKTLLDEKFPKDECRKILPLAFRSQGLIKLPLDIVVYLCSLNQNEYLPDEILNFASQLKEEIPKNAQKLFSKKFQSPVVSIYPFPNIFSDSKISSEVTEVVDYIVDPEIRKERFLERIKRDYENMRREDFYRNLSSSLMARIAIQYYKELSLSAFNEEKRHASIDMNVESIYNALERVISFLKEDFSGISDISRELYIPYSIKNSEMYTQYLDLIFQSLETYDKLIHEGVPQKDAVYIIPQAIKVRLIGLLNSYHIFDPLGYISIRTCSKTDSELRDSTIRLEEKIKIILPEYRDFIGPKCKLGYCLEKVPCLTLLAYTR